MALSTALGAGKSEPPMNWDWVKGNQAAEHDWKWARLHGGAPRPVRPYRLPPEPKPPSVKPDELLSKLKAEITRYTDEKCQAVIGIPQPGGLVLTATDGHRALCEPGEASKPSKTTIIPQAGAQVVLPPSCALALRRVACLAPERSHAVLWTWEGNRLTLSAKSADYGEASEWLDVNDAGDGQTRVCCLDERYILPIFGRKPVVMTWAAHQPEASSLVFHPEGADWRYVVMPMRF